MFDSVISWLENGIRWIVGVLPDSPFANLDMTPVKDILCYINWIVPVGFMLTALSAWLACITIFYIYSAFAKWLKVL